MSDASLLYWYWTGDHWVAAHSMSDPIASVKKFESGWFYAIRIPTFGWSGWVGPFQAEDEAKRLAAPTAVPATTEFRL